MGARVPEGMASLEDLRSGGSEDEIAPESWEMADLEDSIKKLMASSSLASAMSEERSGLENEVISRGLVCGEASEAGKSVDQVDGFLREALQNPRDRLTTLSNFAFGSSPAMANESLKFMNPDHSFAPSLPEEVERFIRNPTQQILEFQPMPSSYLRLAAHRVAQHYFLQSMVMDSGSTEGSRIVARKTGDSRYPTVRLVDIPVESPQEDKAVVLPPMPTKVAIKQRPQKGGRANGDGSGVGGYGAKLNPAKSVEERKEEYNKARARIFCNELAGKGVEDDCELEVGPSDEFYVVEVASVDEKAKAEEPVEDSPPKGFVESPSRGVRMFVTNAEKEKEPLGRVKVSNIVIGNGTGHSVGNYNGSSRVAIFRDREKDRRDPDYDRNTPRYAQRFDPGFGVNVAPFGVQALYAPLVNYNTEFPQLGGPPRPQMHMEPPPPPPIPQQHLQAPWVPPVNALGYRPQDGTLMGPFNPAHMAPMAMYMHAPQFPYPGPAMAYMHPHDRFQQSVSQQPHSQQQPDTSLNQARRR